MLKGLAWTCGLPATAAHKSADAVCFGFPLFSVEPGFPSEWDLPASYQTVKPTGNNGC